MKTTISFLFILIFACGVFTQEKPKVKMVYWGSDKKECSICDSMTVNGVTYNSFETDDFYLSLAGIDADKALQISTYFENNSEKRIEFQPEKAAMAVWAKAGDTKPTEYRPLTPAEASKKLGSNPKLKNFFSQFLAGIATERSTVSTQTSGSVNVMGAGGSLIGVYDEQSNSTITTPNRTAQAQAAADVAARNAEAQRVRDSVLSSALRANTVFPKQYLTGNIYFERIKGYSMYVGILVGDTLYLKLFTPPAK